MKQKQYPTDVLIDSCVEDVKSRYQTEERLVKFSVSILDFCHDFPQIHIAEYFADQLSRASVSASLNYGEAQAAESTKDFIHKMKISLKELRETLICLKIINRSKYFSQIKDGQIIQKEAEELVAIFVASMRTIHAKQN
ncbi:MAG TPA: four helix bundle protein [Bacteroidales bacterium]|nr:four helix bundle protein [Bacteroidales bacterium]